MNDCRKRSIPKELNITSNQNLHVRDVFSGNQVKRVSGQTDFENYVGHVLGIHAKPQPPLFPSFARTMLLLLFHPLFKITIL